MVKSVYEETMRDAMKAAQVMFNEKLFNDLLAYKQGGDTQENNFVIKCREAGITNQAFAKKLFKKMNNRGGGQTGAPCW